MYKDCEIGSIPTNWNIQKLEELANVTGGKRLPKGSSLSEINNGHPYIRVSDMNDKGIQLDSMLYVPDDVVEQISRYRVDKDDLYISVAGTLGLVGKVPDELNGANLTENADRISNIRCNTDFLLYCLKSDFIKKIINSEMTTNAQPKLALTRIKQFPIPVPPLKEQQKIAEILSSVDAAIEKTEQVIAKTEEVKKGLMQQLLTKGIGHTEFKQTEIGEIPFEWGVKNFKDISKVNQGLQIAISARFKDPGINRKIYITIQYLNDKSNKENIYYVENPNANVVCTEEDILMTRTGNTGYVVTGVKGVFHNNFFKVDYDRSKLNRNFLVLYLKSDKIQNKIMTYAGATTIPDLNHGDFYRIPVVIPPIEEQIKIATIIESVQNKINEEYNTLNGLKNIKQGLMQQLLTGQVRVKVD